MITRRIPIFRTPGTNGAGQKKRSCNQQYHRLAACESVISHHRLPACGTVLPLNAMAAAVNQHSSRWYALDVAVEVEAREAVEYALMEAGALGTETNDAGEAALLGVTAYFAHPPERKRVRAELGEALRIYDLPSSSVRDMQFREVAD